ncbi:MAG: hypothetical protein ABIJ45_01175 [Candidatus Zixiibacteriota bacterium]
MTTKTETRIYTSESSKIQYSPEQKFDNKKMRHYSDGKVSVLHCHHYATLFTQLACDADNFNGPKLLCEASYETFYSVLNNYYKKHKVTDLCDRISLAEQYFSFAGLGEIKFEFSDNSGTAILAHSHVDEGWIKKWGQANKSVNYIGEGFIKAAWSAIVGKGNPSKFKVKETESIVTGAPKSKFNFSW